MIREIKGQCVSLRLVTLDDAGFIVGLRNKPNNALFINKTTTDIAQQIDWMKNEFKDSASFYFIILDKSETPIGTVSLYNIRRSRGEFGRWICNGSALESLESALIIHQYAFSVLDLQSVYTRTLESNVKVVSFHRNFGASVSNVPYFDSEYGHNVVKGVVDAAMFPSISTRCNKIIGALL
jgi:RimJ/RimL family protein N-acetyltransferase